jgi:Xaa-Pro aminopeptidase
MPVENNRCTERRERLWAALGAYDEKCDAMLVTSPHNVRYLTGFTGSNGLAVVAPGETWFFTDPRYTFQAAQEVTGRVKAVKSPLLQNAISLVERKKWRRLAIEADHLRVSQVEVLQEKASKRQEFLSRGGVIERLRMVKSEEELAAIRQSVLTNSRALDESLDRLKVGMTEAELATEIEYLMRKLGAEKPSFDTIVAAGERSALPHARPTRAPIGRGVLLIDMGAFQDAYASDMTRTFFVGTAPREMKRIYGAVLESQLAAIDAVRPGVAAAKIDRVARQVLKRHGLEKAFMHSTGHGLGLEIHEPPRLGRKEKTKLEIGMAITIEPGAYVEGVGGVRIEDIVVVTEKGCEILTPTPKQLRVI